tara:strand:- start:1660 stop:2172 length:513 start_codon:yes stop_codon:yes gene_type:complete
MHHKLYKSQVVLDNQRVMINILNNAIPLLEGEDTTWTYHRYNIFGLTSPTRVFYELYNELRGFCYEYTGADQLWMQSWVNYHMPDKVLTRHNHTWPVHGYISIRPHKTKTVFDGFEIDNEIGNVYIGPGLLHHHVEVLEDYDTPRITIGFDLLTDPTSLSGNIGLIPFPK